MYVNTAKSVSGTIINKTITRILCPFLAFIFSQKPFLPLEAVAVILLITIPLPFRFLPAVKPQAQIDVQQFHLSYFRLYSFMGRTPCFGVLLPFRFIPLLLLPMFPGPMSILHSIHPSVHPRSCFHKGRIPESRSPDNRRC